MNINAQLLTNLLLGAARMSAEKGECELAIGLFEKALHQIEDEDGEESVRLPIVLSEMCDCLESLGDDLKAQDCRFRISTILSKYVERNSIAS